MNNTILRAAVAALVLFALCLLANFAAFTIDTPRMRENAAQAVDMLREEGAQPTIIGGYKASQFDNYTTILILKTAAYVGPESLAEKALGGFHVDDECEEGEDPWEAYARYVDDDSHSGLNYARYWHGYTLPLRLLLCLTTLSNIEALCFFAQFILLAALLLLMQKRGLSRLLPPFLFAYFFLMPSVTGICLQYVPVCTLMLAACCALLWRTQYIEESISLGGFFLLNGMLTSYFDLLTFPLLTLGFPLILVLALDLNADMPMRRMTVRGFSVVFFGDVGLRSCGRQNGFHPSQYSVYTFCAAR